MIDKIFLREILNLGDLQNYKLHLACWNGKKQPLDIFFNDTKEWFLWNRYRSNLNRKYVLAFVNLYDEGQDVWLFAGVYKFVNKNGDENDIEECEEFIKFKARLKIKYKAPRQRYLRLENHFENIEVKEILDEPLECVVFTGYRNINLKFTQLKTIIDKNIKDWKTALSIIQGVYLLFDDKDGKYYIGSATGDGGVWNRWSDYINKYTGNNKGLIELSKKVDFDYLKNNFRFVLLEYFSDKTDERYVLERETFWKNILKSRNFNNYNRN